MAAGGYITEAQADGGGFSCTHIQLILRGRFGSGFLRIDSVFIALHHVVVDSVFYVRRDVRTAKDPLIVGLVFREQERDVAFTIQISVTELRMRRHNRLRALLPASLFATPVWEYLATMSRCCETRALVGLVTRPRRVPDSPR